MYKRLYFIGMLAYVVMLVFSVLFYKERVILLDSANNVFHFATHHSFFIGLYRFGDVFSQWLPVIAAKAGLPLDMVAMSYSFSFIFYYFICYFICGTVLKRYDFALIILLQNTLFVSDTFYYIPSPLAQGMAMLMLVLAIAADAKTAPMKIIMKGLLICIIVTVAFYHPLLVIVLIYAAIYFMQKQNAIIDRRSLFFVAVCYFSVLAIKAIFFRTEYETHSMSGMKNFITQFPDYFTLYSNKQFLYSCLTKYYWIPAIFVGITVWYYKEQQWKKLGIFILSFFGYLLLVNVSYPTKETPVFYIENLYLPLAAFLSLPLVFDILPHIAKRNIALPFFVMVLVTFCFRVYATHTMYTARLDWERRFLKEHGDKKVIYPTRMVPMDTLLMVWGTPYEFWLLSTIEQKRTASIIIDDKPELRQWANNVNKSLVVNWNVLPYIQLDKKYFHLVDTVSGYEIIK